MVPTTAVPVKPRSTEVLLGWAAAVEIPTTPVDGLMLKFPAILAVVVSSVSLKFTSTFVLPTATQLVTDGAVLSRVILSVATVLVAQLSVVAMTASVPELSAELTVGKVDIVLYTPEDVSVRVTSPVSVYVVVVDAMEDLARCTFTVEPVAAFTCTVRMLPFATLGGVVVGWVTVIPVIAPPGEVKVLLTSTTLFPTRSAI